MLTPESAKNFVYTKRLELYLSVYSTTFVETSQCSAIYSKLKKLLDVYNYTSASLQKLILQVEPFIPTDVAHDGLWPILNSCNDGIYHFLGQLKYRETDLKDFNLTVGRDSWRYDETFRPHLEAILWMLGPKVTLLDILEYPSFLAPRLSTMKRLKVLQFGNISSMNEPGSLAIWKSLTPLGISKVCLVGFSLPRNLYQYVSRTVTSLTLNRLDDVVTACLICYSQLSQLEVCALNWGKVKSVEAARSAIVKETACTRLRQVCFLDSFAPPGIVSVISKANPQLDFCGAPINVSDEDVYSLAKHCKRLRVLDMSWGNIDEITPHIKPTKIGLTPISQLRRLNHLSLRLRDASLLDRQLLLDLADSLRLIRVFDISVPHDRPKDDIKSVIRAGLSGSEEFKDWVHEFIEEVEKNTWGINLNTLRGNAHDVRTDLVREIQ
jgi:hypothetical protein